MDQVGPQREPLVTFIETAKAKGASEETLVKLLQRRGWPEEEIYEALAKVYEKMTGQQAPSPSLAGRGESRDAFLWVLEHFALGVWTVSLGSIMFEYIDRWFPGTGSFRRGAAVTLYSISNEIAAIVVALPTQLILERIMARDFEQYPEKAASQARKRIIYFVLFITASIAIGDLITFLAESLRGELTIRFLLQAATVIVISGGIFLRGTLSLRHIKKRAVYMRQNVPSSNGE